VFKCVNQDFEMRGIKSGPIFNTRGDRTVEYTHYISKCLETLRDLNVIEDGDLEFALVSGWIVCTAWGKVKVRKIGNRVAKK